MSTVASAARLLHHASHGIIGLHHIVNTCRPALSVPTVLMAPGRIRRQVSVQVVAVARRCNSVFGLIVVDLERSAGATLRNRLGNVAKGIVAEVLYPGGKRTEGIIF